MKKSAVILMLTLAVSCQAHEKQNKDDHSPDGNLQEDTENIFSSKPDSSHDHHEAFLGKQESKIFEQLSPEESKERLKKLVVEQIDKNKDGVVSEEELREWIAFTSRKYLEENRDKHWKSFNVDDSKLLSWEKYTEMTFGENTSQSKDPEGLKTLKALIAKDERRWKQADEDKDGKLNKDEFLAFLHPEEVPRMHSLVIQESMEDMDKNKDGFVDLEEYIQDLWTPATPNDVEPKWVAAEREHFGLYRDKNKDGLLDAEEMRDWILPRDYDHVTSEAQHLMTQADSNADNQLTVDEILEHLELFIGSQATEFGAALNRHDEL